MQKVLIIKLGALGDIIMSSSLLKQIQEHHKDSQVFLLTSPAFTGLFSNWPGLTVQSFPRKGLAASIKTLRWIRKQGFSRLYDLQSNDRSGFYCALSNIPLRVGNHPRFPYHLHPRDRWSGQCHIFERMLDVLRAGGISAKNELPSLPVADQDRDRVAAWLDRKELSNKPLVIMHAGGSPQHPQKRWPGFGELAKKLELSNYHIIWVGGDADTDLNHSLAEKAGIDASNEFSLQELIVLGKLARFAVANDSGPMHVLSCCGIPVYGLFGPTDWRRNHGIGQHAHVISLNKEAKEFRPTQLKDLEVEQVIEQLSVDSLL